VLHGGHVALHMPSSCDPMNRNFEIFIHTSIWGLSRGHDFTSIWIQYQPSQRAQRRCIDGVSTSGSVDVETTSKTRCVWNLDGRLVSTLIQRRVSTLFQRRFLTSYDDYSEGIISQMYEYKIKLSWVCEQSNLAWLCVDSKLFGYLYKTHNNNPYFIFSDEDGL